jgi:hypothetical protein
MREHLEKLNYPQLLKISQTYNEIVSIPHPSKMKKTELINAILERAKDQDELMSVIKNISGDETHLLKKLVRTASMSDEEFVSLERKRDRTIRQIDRTKKKYEPLTPDRELNADEKKALKKEIAHIIKEYNAKKGGTKSIKRKQYRKTRKIKK